MNIFCLVDGELTAAVNLKCVDDGACAGGGYDAIYGRDLCLLDGEEEYDFLRLNNLTCSMFAKPFGSTVVNYSWHGYICPQ